MRNLIALLATRIRVRVIRPICNHGWGFHDKYELFTKVSKHRVNVSFWGNGTESFATVAIEGIELKRIHTPLHPQPLPTRFWKAIDTKLQKLPLQEGRLDLVLQYFRTQYKPI